MEWLAPLVPPVRFGVKLNTINSCLELLLCDQIMDLTKCICYTSTNNNGISLLFAHMKQTKGFFIFFILIYFLYSILWLVLHLPTSDTCPSSISGPLIHSECYWSSWSPFHCIQDLHRQRTLSVRTTMFLLQCRHKPGLSIILSCSLSSTIFNTPNCSLCNCNVLNSVCHTLFFEVEIDYLFNSWRPCFHKVVLFNRWRWGQPKVHGERKGTNGLMYRQPYTFTPRCFKRLKTSGIDYSVSVRWMLQAVAFSLQDFQWKQFVLQNRYLIGICLCYKNKI